VVLIASKSSLAVFLSLNCSVLSTEITDLIAPSALVLFLWNSASLSIYLTASSGLYALLSS
jgi:hypothetical protein